MFLMGAREPAYNRAKIGNGTTREGLTFAAGGIARRELTVAPVCVCAFTVPCRR